MLIIHTYSILNIFEYIIQKSMNISPISNLKRSIIHLNETILRHVYIIFILPKLEEHRRVETTVSYLLPSVNFKCIEITTPGREIQVPAPVSQFTSIATSCIINLPFILVTQE